ncbi:MAG TPA: hypothetical protein VLT87_01430 [Thermoanaerobaculia bacterium]|nr:hypothetical protein [Thermoanaerobaculia bacterium]
MIDLAVLEHRSGVLPLAAAFFERGAIDEAVADPRIGALGLFTPAPEPGFGAVALTGVPADGGVLVSGRVRLPGPGSAADGSIVLVRIEEEEEPRLAWLDHGAPGVLWRGDGPCWLDIEKAAIPDGLVSRPVSLAPGSELFRCLEAYAGVWASAAAKIAREGVRALRRAARITGFNAAQTVAFGITEVEIEADLTFAAAERNPGLAVAAAAARTLSAVVRKTEDLRDSMGLEIDGPLAGSSAKALIASLGGAPLLENELARALGIGEAGG